MSSKNSDKRLYFIAQAKAAGICDNVTLSNVWYITTKDAKTLPTAEALEKFRAWLGADDAPHYTAEHMKRLDAACKPRGSAYD